MTGWSEWTVNVFCVLVDRCKSGDPNKHRRSLRMCRWLTLIVLKVISMKYEFGSIAFYGDN
jgi:hypothetical protein